MDCQNNFKLQICKSCVIISTRPRITFNEKGFCNACDWKFKKKNLNWKKRKIKLINRN